MGPPSDIHVWIFITFVKKSLKDKWAALLALSCWWKWTFWEEPHSCSRLLLTNPTRCADLIGTIGDVSSEPVHKASICLPLRNSQLFTMTNQLPSIHLSDEIRKACWQIEPLDFPDSCHYQSSARRLCVFHESVQIQLVKVKKCQFTWLVYLAPVQVIRSPHISLTHKREVSVT